MIPLRDSELLILLLLACVLLVCCWGFEALLRQPARRVVYVYEGGPKGAGGRENHAPVIDPGSREAAAEGGNQHG